MPKILVIKPSSLGDIIHGLQVVQSMREQMENLEVTWVVRDMFEPFVSSCNTVDRTLIFERQGGISAFICLLKEIRMERYDWVLDMQGLARSAIITALSRGRHKCGRRDARELAWLGYQHRTTTPMSKHAVDILLEFLPLMGLKARLGKALVFDQEPLSQHVPEELLGNAPILLFPNSRRAEKEWRHFPALTQALLKNFPDKAIVWLGQTPIPDEACSGQDFYNLMGKTTLADMVTLIQSASCIVCNDSGPMHLAAAMKKPTVALFGPTCPERFGPYPLDSNKHTVLIAPEEQLDKLRVERVAEAIDAYVK